MLLQTVKAKSGASTANVNEVLAELQKDHENLKENLASIKNMVLEMEGRCERMNISIIKIAQKIHKQ